MAVPDINIEKEATQKKSRSKLWSKLSIANRLSTGSSKLDKDELPPQHMTSTPSRARSARSTITEPLIVTHPKDEAESASLDVQTPSNPPLTIPEVKALREQLVKARLDSVTPSSLEKFKSEFGSKYQDTKTSGPLHLCRNRTWRLLEFCVLEPLKCLADGALSLWNENLPGKAKANNDAMDPVSPTFPRAVRSAGTLVQLR